jgi:hypothetical protein
MNKTSDPLAKNSSPERSFDEIFFSVKNFLIDLLPLLLLGLMKSPSRLDRHTAPSSNLRGKDHVIAL